MKRLDTIDDKLDQLLIATAKISAQYPELPQMDKPLAYQTQSAGRLFGGRSTELPAPE